MITITNIQASLLSHHLNFKLTSHLTYNHRVLPEAARLNQNLLFNVIIFPVHFHFLTAPKIFYFINSPLAIEITLFLPYLTISTIT